jgi:hypothetical protein
LFISILCFISFQSLFGVWLSLFLSTLATVVWLTDESPSLALKYFLIQEVLTGLVLFSLAYGSDWSLFSVLLYLKLALPPFHSWFLKILYSSGTDRWILGCSKLVPTLWLFILQLPTSLPLLFILFQVVYALLDVITVKGVMFLSSCLNLFWGMILAQVNVNYGFVWVIAYSYITYIFLTVSRLVWQDILVVTGLPPSILFFIKVYFVTIFDSSLLLLVGFLISTFVLFLRYLSVLEYTSVRDKLFRSPVFRLNLYSVFVFLLCLVLLFLFSLVQNITLKQWKHSRNSPFWNVDSPTFSSCLSCCGPNQNYYLLLSYFIKCEIVMFCHYWTDSPWFLLCLNHLPFQFEYVCDTNFPQLVDNASRRQLKRVVALSFHLKPVFECPTGVNLVESTYGVTRFLSLWDNDIRLVIPYRNNQTNKSPSGTE